jgi:hypothetical protein
MGVLGEGMRDAVRRYVLSRLRRQAGMGISARVVSLEMLRVRVLRGLGRRR